MLAWPEWTEARGRLNDLIYSRNPAGQYTRPYVYPVEVFSTHSIAVSLLFQLFAPRWRTILTSSDRARWNTWAATRPRRDALGQIQFLTGYQFYLGIAVQRARALAGSRNAPLDLPGGAGLSIVTIDVTPPDTAVVTVDSSDRWAQSPGGFIMVSASPPRPPTVNFHKTPFRKIGTMLKGLGPLTNPATFTLPTAVVAGDRVFFRVVCQTGGCEQSPSRILTHDVA